MMAGVPGEEKKKTREKNALLIAAIVRGQKEAVRQALTEGASPNAIDLAGGSGLSALELAVDANRPDIAQILLDAGLPRAALSAGVARAMQSGDVGALRWLKAAGADLNAPCRDDADQYATPLTLAA